MSEHSSRVSDAHFEYVRAHTDPEDPFLVELKEAARAAEIPAIWISHEQATFMQIVLRLAGACDVVEVGTLAGYSAIAMARALPGGGRVRTIELEPRHADFAESWVARSDVAERVVVHRGPGDEVLRGFADGSADAAFLDADKSSYPIYAEEAHRILRPGGLLMVDNAFAFGQLLDERPTDREVPAVRAFNDAFGGDTRWDRLILPVGDGLWVARKRS